MDNRGMYTNLEMIGEWKTLFKDQMNLILQTLQKQIGKHIMLKYKQNQMKGQQKFPERLILQGLVQILQTQGYRLKLINHYQWQK